MADERAVHGECDPAFDGVRQAFADNFERRGELGAAVAVTVDGRPVVDLWGGVADEATGRPWEADTLALIFSGTKAMIGLCLLMLVDRGDLDLDAPVCRYWPEFAAHGKEGVTVRDVASHTSRLPGLRVRVLEDEIADDRRMAALLADQPLESDPRAPDTYHPLTFGWLCGELVHRIDGRSVGRFLAEEVAAPLGLELWIGLPPTLERRVFTARYADSWMTARGWLDGGFAEDELLDRVFNNPTIFPADRLPSNRPEWHQAEIPAIGGIATARSLARLYGCLARGGELDGVRLLSEATLRLGLRDARRRWDPLLAEERAVGIGLLVQTAQQPLGPPWDAFGHTGAGGSAHCAWPSQRIGFSYTMNLMRDDDFTDPRAQALMAAAYEAALDLRL